jgi:hypothetical protein
LGANIVKATLEVETRCDGIERKIDGHFEGSWQSEGSRRVGRVDEGDECLEVESKRGSQPESTEFLCLHVKAAASVVGTGSSGLDDAKGERLTCCVFRKGERLESKWAKSRNSTRR